MRSAYSSNKLGMCVDTSRKIYVYVATFRFFLQASREHRPQSQSLFTRVPFQEESDNIKNFPNMKVFHAFKKQRYLHAVKRPYCYRGGLLSGVGTPFTPFYETGRCITTHQTGTSSLHCKTRSGPPNTHMCKQVYSPSLLHTY